MRYPITLEINDQNYWMRRELGWRKQVMRYAAIVEAEDGERMLVVLCRNGKWRAWLGKIWPAWAGENTEYRTVKE